MRFHENRLPADDSHEISSLICYFEKAANFEIVVCCKLYVALSGLSVFTFSAFWQAKGTKFTLFLT